MFVSLSRALRAATFLISMTSATAFAQEPAPSPSPSALPEIGHVVTSDRHSESITHTSRPTFIVDRATIENTGARTIADALASVPGFNFFRYGPFGAQIDYGIRGATSAQTLVLRDGVPIAAGSNGVVDLGQLSTTGVRRIEVVESGSSTLYGTGATGGVVNIITGAPDAPLVRMATGSYGENDLAAEAGTRNVTYAFERHSANNAFAYPALAYSTAGSFPAGVRTNADALETAFRAAYRTPLANHWELTLSGGNDTSNIGVPGDLAFGLTPQARQNTNHSDGTLALERSTYRSTLTVTFSDVAQRLAYIDPDPNDFINGGENDTYDNRTQASLKYVTSWSRGDLVTGVDFARETALLWLGPPPVPQTSPPTASSLSANESQSGAYAQYSYQTSAALNLTGGIRFENDALHGSALAPSLGLRFALGKNRLTANVGQSFRVPTLIDLYYPGFSNPALQPEKLTNYDVTLQMPELAGGVSFGYFGRNGANLISVDQTTFIPFNAGHAAVNGFQVTAATKPLHHVQVTVSLTDLYKALDASSGLRLPRTPPILATFGLDRPFDGGAFAFGAHARIAGSTGGNGPSATTVLDRYTNADAYVRYRVHQNLIASLRIQNLGNERYAPIYGYPASGRSYTFEISTR